MVHMYQMEYNTSTGSAARVKETLEYMQYMIYVKVKIISIYKYGI